MTQRPRRRHAAARMSVDLFGYLADWIAAQRCGRRGADQRDGEGLDVGDGLF